MFGKKITSSYPKDEIFGITSQMRRAAVSIPSNIAEGYGRLYEKDTVRFLSTALGSASELETQMLISKQLMLASDQELDDLLMLNNEIIRMLVALSKKLSNQ